jgi:hypothetical protein
LRGAAEVEATLRMRPKLKDVERCSQFRYRLCVAVLSAVVAFLSAAIEAPLLFPEQRTGDGAGV